MPLVGARLRAEVDDAAGELAPFRTHVVVLHLEFADGILRWYKQRQVDVADVQWLAIKVFRALIGERSADLIVARSKGFLPTVRTLRTALRNHRWGQRRQVKNVAAIQRNFSRLASGDHLPEGRAIRLQQRRFARYFHRLTDFAQLHRQIDAGCLLDLYDDIRLLGALESGLFGRNAIVAWK